MPHPASRNPLTIQSFAHRERPAPTVVMTLLAVSMYQIGLTLLMTSNGGEWMLNSHRGISLLWLALALWPTVLAMIHLRAKAVIVPLVLLCVFSAAIYTNTSLIYERMQANGRFAAAASMSPATPYCGAVFDGYPETVARALTSAENWREARARASVLPSACSIPMSLPGSITIKPLSPETTFDGDSFST